MSTIKVEILTSRTTKGLQRKINEFFKREHMSEYTLKGIHYLTASVETITPYKTEYSALIVYYTGTKHEINL